MLNVSFMLSLLKEKKMIEKVPRQELQRHNIVGRGHNPMGKWMFHFVSRVKSLKQWVNVGSRTKHLAQQKEWAPLPQIAHCLHEWKITYTKRNVKNASFLGGTFLSYSLPLVGSRNLIADLSLYSQASSINIPDTKKPGLLSQQAELAHQTLL